jgi:CheY-like chemotaxis protein
MVYEVLVIDDNASAAREYARLITLMTGVEAFATADPEEAAAILKTYSIKVAVLDQRMPVKGTEVFRILKAADSQLKVLMLSGEADTQELDEAYKLGYDDYLHKSRIEELGARIQTLYAKYKVDMIKRQSISISAPLMIEKRGIWPFQVKVEYFVTSLILLDEHFIFPESWKTTKQLNAGETVKESDTVEIESRFMIEQVDEQKAGTELSTEIGKLAKVKGKIEETVSSKYTTNVYEAHKKQVQISREYKLPEAPADPNELHVASRHFQRAPVYRQIRILVVKRCSCCSSEQLVPLVVYQLTSKTATRHMDYFSDGTEKCLHTGLH